MSQHQKYEHLPQKQPTATPISLWHNVLLFSTILLGVAMLTIALLTKITPLAWATPLASFLAFTGLALIIVPVLLRFMHIALKRNPELNAKWRALAWKRTATALAIGLCVLGIFVAEFGASFHPLAGFINSQGIRSILLSIGTVLAVTMAGRHIADLLNAPGLKNDPNHLGYNFIRQAKQNKPLLVPAIIFGVVIPTALFLLVRLLPSSLLTLNTFANFSLGSLFSIGGGALILVSWVSYFAYVLSQKIRQPRPLTPEEPKAETLSERVMGAKKYINNLTLENSLESATDDHFEQTLLPNLRAEFLKNIQPLGLTPRTKEVREAVESIYRTAREKRKALQREAYVNGDIQLISTQGRYSTLATESDEEFEQTLKEISITISRGLTKRGATPEEAEQGVNRILEAARAKRRELRPLNPAHDVLYDYDEEETAQESKDDVGTDTQPTTQRLQRRETAIGAKEVMAAVTPPEDLSPLRAQSVFPLPEPPAKRERTSSLSASSKPLDGQKRREASSASSPNHPAQSPALTLPG